MIGAQTPKSTINKSDTILEERVVWLLAKDDWRMAIAVGVAWEFLLRLQSEDRTVRVDNSDSVQRW